MELEAITAAVRDVSNVKRVFGEPYELDGVTVIPVARAGGGGGGGSGGPDDTGATGGGFGVAAYPVGVYVVRDGRVEFIPIRDLDTIVKRVSAVAIVGLLTWASVARARQRRKRTEARHG